MKTYLMIDIDDIHFNNQISQINYELFEKYCKLCKMSMEKGLKVEIIRFTKVFNKKDYEYPKVFSTMKKFALKIIQEKKISYVDIHVTYRNLLPALLVAKYIKT